MGFTCFGKGRFGNNVITVAIEFFWAYLLLTGLAVFLYGIGMIGQPVMQEDGGRNAEGKYQQQHSSTDFFYGSPFKHFFCYNVANINTRAGNSK
jgi:hypothetical protein